MKNRIRLLLAALLLPAALKAQQAQGHRIELHLSHAKDSTVYLGNYYGTQTYLVDTSRLNERGNAVFDGPDTLARGIYFILLSDHRHYFEFLVGTQQHFSILADSADGFRELRFEHSPDNELFSRYNRFLRNQQERLARARARGADTGRLNALQREIGDTVMAYRERFVKAHPQAVLSTLFRGMLDPRVPPRPAGADSGFAYRYFKDHYWDGVDFSDNTLVRSPVLQARLERYFDKLVTPDPDSVDREADALIARARANSEMFKYILYWLTYHYETSPYMGMDAVFVHLVEKYYMTGQAFWLNKDMTDKIIQRASQIAPNLIGNRAPDLDLRTADLQPFDLYKAQGNYIVLVFWDPTCGHCQIIVPELDSAYEAHWKREGVTMVGVRSGGTKQQWQEFIQAHHMEDWINLWDPENSTNYRRLYDVYMTPIIYLLDSRKKILAKHLSVQQVDAFLKHLKKEPPRNS